MNSCKALCPFYQPALGTSKVWEWNKVDKMFGLVDFFIFDNTCAINTTSERRSISGGEKPPFSVSYQDWLPRTDCVWILA